MVLGALAEMDWRGQAQSFEAELTAQLEGLFPLFRQAARAPGELLSASLQWLIGPAAVSGPGAGSYLASPWVYQKGDDPGTPSATELTVCRKRTCVRAPVDPREFSKQIELGLG
jgi:hypothetical protein